MNRTFLDPAVWSRGRWWTTFLIAFLLQVMIIYQLSDRNPLVPKPVQSSPAYYLVVDAPADPVLAELLNINDPTLFALPNLRGFSGPAWLRPDPLVHRLEGREEPHRWLTLNLAELGAAFNELARTNVVAHRSFADKPARRLSEVNPPPIPLRTNSSFRIEGELARRKLLTRVEVPSIAHTDILTNTVVQLGVNPSGYPFPPIFLNSSGSKAADQEALKLAKSMRFKPLGPADGNGPRSATALMWGKVVFEWHTLELAATNAPVGTAPQE